MVCGNTLRMTLPLLLLLGVVTNAKLFPISNPFLLGLNGTENVIENGTENGVGIGIGASSSISIVFCPDETVTCSENSVCTGCLETLFSSEDDDGDDDGDDDDTAASCDEVEEGFCASVLAFSADSCTSNDHYMNWVECFGETFSGCTVDCNGAIGLPRSSGVTLLFSAAVAGFLVAATGMVL